MRKENYEIPEVEVVRFPVEDIITTSGEPSVDTPRSEWDDE